MKYLITKSIGLVFLLITSVVYAQNPIIQTKFTADPAPLVYKDTVFLYTTRDEDNAGPGMGKFLMKDWLLYTSVDMVNWTDHGVVATLKDFKWGRQDNGAWAPQCVEQDGKFYLYCPVQGSGIGVLVADSPYGPFKDPLGKRLIESDHIWNDIDPTVMKDDNGQAYLYWGNPNLWYVKLNKDMISYSGEVTKVPGVGKEKNQNIPDAFHYQEGPWAYKRNGNYYMAYASTCCPEGMAYAMSKSPEGPWEYKGYIMQPNKKSSGNHPGIIDYKGKTYVFGFNFRLNFMITDKHHERRSVCVAEMKYNPDGTIQELPWWTEEGLNEPGDINPYVVNQAETIAWASGLKTEKDSIGGGGMYVTAIDNNDHIKVRGVKFTQNTKKFMANIASASGGTIEIHADSLDGKLLATCAVNNTGGLQKWKTLTTKIKKTKGTHDLYFVFKGEDGNLFNFNWWQFK